jgi:SSS family solute:Na+ symporter
VAKFASLVVKVGALVFIIFVPVPFALQFQLLGGLWMSQVLPSVILGLYLRMLNGWALLAGWAVGAGLGTWMASTTSFKAAVYTVTFMGTSYPSYIALWALGANILVSVVLSLLLKPFVAPAPGHALSAD